MKKFLILLLFLMTLTLTANALPNPASLNEEAKKSKVKEVAKVVKIETDKNANNLRFVTVTFKNDKRTFKGHCVTENKFYNKKNMLVGPLILHPKKGQTVYVTITEENGKITTYQPLKRKEVKIYKNMPYKIKYNMGKAYIED